MNIGKYIAEKRNALRFSQRELAERVGVSNVTISKIENGSTVSPDVSIIKKIEKVLELEDHELISMYYPNDNVYIREAKSEYTIDELLPIMDDELIKEYKGEQIKKIKFVEDITRDGISIDDLKAAVQMIKAIKSNRK